MKKIVSILCAMVAAGSVAASQNPNLNPTVNVTKDYDGQGVQAERQLDSIRVPDTLTRLNLNFKYSGLESKYNGGKEFNPVLTELVIEAPEELRKCFYLKAGAGYTFRPELDLAWTFKNYGRFKAGLFARNRSYWGKYWAPSAEGGSIVGQKDVSRTGFDGQARLGMDGRADWDALSLNFALWYDGVYAKDDQAAVPGQMRFYNGGRGLLSLISNIDRRSRGWTWALKLYGGYGMDRLDVSGTAAAEGNYGGKGLISFNAGNSYVDIDVGFDWTHGRSYDGGTSYRGWVADLHPKYYLSSDRVSLGLGAAILMNGAEGAAATNRNFDLFPIVKLSWQAVPDYFELYLNSDMKASVYGVRSQALEHSFYIADSVKNVVKTAVAEAGMRGRAGRGFEYKLGAAYNWIQNSPDVLLRGGDGVPFTTEICHQEVHNMEFAASLTGRFCGFTVKGDVMYRLVFGKEKLKVVQPPLTAALNIDYSLLDRFIFSVGADYSHTWRSGGYMMPFFVDLHAGTSYRFTRSFSLYLRGENLLNMCDNAIPLHSRRGIAVTGGIVLNF